VLTVVSVVHTVGHLSMALMVVLGLVLGLVQMALDISWCSR
jgi:hypothetical protein